MPTQFTSDSWATSRDTVPGGFIQITVYAEGSGERVATVFDAEAARLIAVAPALCAAARCALADLEGIMPEFESSGDRTHPGWKTIQELRAALAEVDYVQP